MAANPKLSSGQAAKFKLQHLKKRQEDPTDVTQRYFDEQRERDP